MSTLTASWSKSKTTQRRLRDLLGLHLVGRRLCLVHLPTLLGYYELAQNLSGFQSDSGAHLPFRLVPGKLSQRLEQRPLCRYFINTAIIVSLSVVGELISASLVGFGFSRLKFWGRNSSS